MDLFYDFTGAGMPEFPSGQKTIGQLLTDSELKGSPQIKSGPLVLILDSSIYIYDSKRTLLYSKLLRTNPSSGFYPMTAISHIGPAMAYLAKIKQSGDDGWKKAMTKMLSDIRAVREINQSGLWLKEVNVSPWISHQSQIQSMVDYALSMSGNYMVSVLNGANFDLPSVQSNFLNGNEKYPIPFNNVMVATFMLVTLESMDDVYRDIKDKSIDWSHAMVIIRNVAGANVTAGLTKGTNWMVPFVEALSHKVIPPDSIIIAPYAEVRSDAGQNTLSTASFQYYKNDVWMNAYNRRKIAKGVYTDISTVYLPGRPSLPGDYSYSKAGDVADFMIRIKLSLQDPREMLSNSVGFWMAGELAAKNWQTDKVAIPGLTNGFPKGISAYPSNNPEIGVVK